MGINPFLKIYNLSEGVSKLGSEVILRSKYAVLRLLYFNEYILIIKPANNKVGLILQPEFLLVYYLVSQWIDKDWVRCEELLILLFWKITTDQPFEFINQSFGNSYGRFRKNFEYRKAKGVSSGLAIETYVRIILVKEVKEFIKQTLANLTLCYKIVKGFTSCSNYFWAEGKVQRGHNRHAPQHKSRRMLPLRSVPE